MNTSLDFSGINRIFAFGCSFTHYSWPTWADLIAFQYPKTEYYNYGMAGLGNLGIAARLNEANVRFKFNNSDLVMILWTTFCREDRWINGNWFTQGNVFNSTYEEQFVKKYADPTGYMIRDHALINLTNSYVRSLDCKSLILKSSPIDFNEALEVDTGVMAQIKELYGKTYNELPMDLYTFMGNDFGLCKQYFFEDTSEKPYMRHDQHPFTSLYAEYLTELGIKLDKNTLDFAIECDHILKRCKTRSDIMNLFSFMDERKKLGITNKLF